MTDVVRSAVDFDYTRAWREFAWPQWQSLPADVRKLAHDVAQNCGGLAQDRNTLELEWPEDETTRVTLRVRFDAIPAETLAWASQVVYSVGHWCPSIPAQYTIEHTREYLEALQEGKKLQATGGYWRFSNFADQVLGAKIDRPTISRFYVRKREPLKGSGARLSRVVDHGMLVLVTELRTDRQETMWRSPIGWATAAAMERADSVRGDDKGALVGVDFFHSTFDELDAYFRRHARDLRGHCGDRDERFREWADLSRFGG